jgi:hypothetical protein
VFVEQDARLGIAQQPGQRGLAVEKRAAPQILAIVLDQVEGIEDRGPRSLLSAQLIESRQAVGPHHNRLAVDREALGPIRSAAAAISTATDAHPGSERQGQSVVSAPARDLGVRRNQRRFRSKFRSCAERTDKSDPYRYPVELRHELSRLLCQCRALRVHK